MKNNLALFGKYATVGLLASIFASSPTFGNELFRPYIGVGAQMLNLDLDKAYGQPLFKKNLPGVGIFAGFKMGDFVGIELGYNRFSRKQERLLNSGDILPGLGVTLNEATNGALRWIRYSTRAQITDFNLGLTGYLPLERVSCALNNTELFASLGFSRSLVKLAFAAIANSAEVNQNPIIYRGKKTKTIPFASVGVKQNITENISASLFSEWRRLNVFKIRVPFSSDTFEFRLKNSISYGVKLNYAF